MKYLNTREAFLSTINETFVNDITFGGSLFGRLVNSIIRKAKIAVNYEKVNSIANAIKIELDGLIAKGLSTADQHTLSNITSRALLDEIYNVVQSDESEQKKLYFLLDEDKEGLITQAINFLKTLPDGVKLGAGDKNTLISKLENFKELLEEIEKELGPISNDERQEADQDADYEIIEDGDDEDKIFVKTHDLLQSVVNIHNFINKKDDTNSDTSSNINSTNNEDQPEKDTTVDDTEVNNTSLSPSKKPQFNKKKPQLNSGQKELNTGQKLIGNERILNFWGFFSQINELMIGDNKELTTPNKTQNNQGHKSNRLGNEPFKVINGGKKKSEEEKNKGEYIDYQMVDDDPQNKQDTNHGDSIWDKLIKEYNKSGISEHIPMIKNLLKKSEEKNSLERKWIIRIGKQIITNTLTITKNQNLLESNSDVIATAIPKSISILSNVFISLKDNINKLGKLGEYVNQFIDNYTEIIKFSKLQTTGKHEIKLKENLFNYYIIEADTTFQPNYKVDIPVSDNEDKGVSKTDDNSDIHINKTDTDANVKLPKTVNESWSSIFKKGEENDWKLDEDEAKRAQHQFENAKFQINLVDEDGKDRIVKICNLFGKAYRCFAFPIIPSGRPNNIISNKTYQEYTYIGAGTPGVPSKDSGPGFGPWASKSVLNRFTNDISKFIEEDKYKKIFNRGTIKVTNGRDMKGNVLLEFMRDMIDETELKSYDQNRSKLLNKYFDLPAKISTVQYKEGDIKDANGVLPNSSDAIRWKNVEDSLHSLEVGSFIALNCKFQESGKEVDRIIIGQVIDFRDNKALIKWSYDTESINIAYSGAGVLSKDEQISKTVNTADVHFGLIDLSETKLLENEPFIMTFVNAKNIDRKNRGIMDTNKIIKKKYKPFKHFTNRKKNVAISILSKRDKDGNLKPIISENINTKLDNSIVTKDVLIDINDVFGDLKDKLEDKTKTIS